MGWDNVLRVHISVVMRLATDSGRHVHNRVCRQGREAYRHETLSTTTLSQLFYSESPIPSPEKPVFGNSKPISAESGDLIPRIRGETGVN